MKAAHPAASVNQNLGWQALQTVARQRAQQTATLRQQRQAHAWEVARAAAVLLKTQYHATHVKVFGSLLKTGHFQLWSDLDLAVWGLAPTDYFDALAQLLDLAHELPVDLIMAEKCKPYLREAIEGGTEL